GVCLHELLTKSDPVKNNPAFQFQGIRNLNPAVSQELEDLVNRALSIDPALRPQSALEFKKALEALLGRGDTTQIIPQILQPVAPQPAVVSLQPQQPASQPHLPVQPLSHPPFPVLLPRGATRRRPPTPVMKWIIVAFALLMTIWSLATGVPKWLRLTQSEVSGKTPSPSPVVYQPPVPPPRPGKNVLGINSYNAGKYNEALDFLEEYRNDHPTDGEVFLYKQNVLAASQSKPQLILKVLRSTRRAPYRNTESVLRGLALGIEAINTAGGIEGALLQAVPISSDIGIGKSSIRHLSTWAQCAAVLGATFEKPVNEREWRGLLEDSGIPNLFPTVNPGVLHTTMKEVADRKDLAELGLELVRGDPGYVEDFLLRAPQSGHNFFFFPPVVLTDSTLRVTRLAPNSTFYALSFFDPNTPTGDALHFVQAHKKTFPRVYPDPWAALGYDSVGYLASLLKEAGADWASASQASREKEYQGITGKITKGSGLLPSQWFLVKVNLAEINRIQEVRNLP
ncbi:MAG: hypothetical protein HYU64_15305, partial [Armatimonadetes bacterium]|nr:hypothetical protein [Armatimonadota bacterium]